MFYFMLNYFSNNRDIISLLFTGSTNASSHRSHGDTQTALEDTPKSLAEAGILAHNNTNAMKNQISAYEAYLNILRNAA